MHTDSIRTVVIWIQSKILLLAGVFILAGTCVSPAAEKLAPATLVPFPEGRFTLERGEIVAFVGGTDVAASVNTGHLEALLAIKFRGLGVRCRNFGWEGDTVFAQPRDVGFPPLAEHLHRVGATVIVLQFGRVEVLDGHEALPRFIDAYQKLIDECAHQTPRLVLVTPPPYEDGGAQLPRLSSRNPDLAAYVEAIRDIARKRKLPLVDLFVELGGASHREPRLTDNGLQLTPRGQALVARAFARQIGLGGLAQQTGEPDKNGVWPNAEFERVRQSVIAKNKLWFDYWRPQNWAFLGGDRTSQPSSRDHRDPNLRWFPVEMEKFVPLIEQAEARVDQTAGMISLK